MFVSLAVWQVNLTFHPSSTDHNTETPRDQARKEECAYLPQFLVRVGNAVTAPHACCLPTRRSPRTEVPRYSSARGIAGAAHPAIPRARRVPAPYAGNSRVAEDVRRLLRVASAEVQSVNPPLLPAGSCKFTLSRFVLKLIMFFHLYEFQSYETAPVK